MLALAAAAPLALAPSMMTVEQAVSALEQTHSVDLQVDPVFRNEPILLELSGELESDRRKLATVLAAEWEGTRLQPDSDRRSIEAQAAKESLIQRLQDAKADWLERNAAPNFSSPEGRAAIRESVEQQRQMIEPMMGNLAEQVGDGQVARISLHNSALQTPEKAALSRAIRELTPEFLAEIMPGDRVVMSNRPTQRQRRLPFRAELVTSSYMQDRSVFAQEVGPEEIAPQMIVDSPLTRASRQLPTPPTRLVLSVERMSSETPTYHLVLWIATTDGTLAGETQGTLSASPPEGNAEASAADGTVRLSEQSEALVRALASSARLGDAGGSSFGFSTGGRELRLTDPFETPKPLPTGAGRGLMLTPQANEPLSLFVADALRSLAVAYDADLLARPRDTAFRPLLELMAQGQASLSSVEAALRQSGHTVGVEDGVLYVLPEEGAQAEAERINRSALEQLLGRINGQGYSRLIDRVAYASTKAGPALFDEVYLTALDSATAEELFTGTEAIDRHRMLEGFAPDALTFARSEQAEIVLPRLTARAKQAAERIVYARNGASLIGEGAMMSVSIGDEGVQPLIQPSSLEMEPTERLPRGLPANALIRMERTPEPAVLARDLATQRTRLYSASELGILESIRRNTPSATLSNPDGGMQFRNAVSGNVVVSILEPRGGDDLAAYPLVDGEAQQGPWQQWSQLGQEFLAAVEEARTSSENIRISPPDQGRTDPPISLPALR